MRQISISVFNLKQQKDFDKAYLSFQGEVLHRKAERERTACQLINHYRNNYTVDILNHILDLVDNDPTGRWFGQMLSVPNRKALFTSPIEDINAFLDKLLATESLYCLGEWRRSGNKGIRTGISSLLLYLHSPERLCIWVKRTQNGLSKVCDVHFDNLSKEYGPQEYEEKYGLFNKYAVKFRQDYGINPHGLDWVLWAIGEIVDNPQNPHLVKYISDSTLEI
ncbi:MAG: hypothetical protein ACFFCW_05040 [Candidatus Hodarchaeota archaeon]